MSQLPPDALTYEAVVTEYFLGLRGVGLMLSPLDLALVRGWERRGVPVAVVCSGLRQGLEDARRDRPPASPLPRSVRAYRRSVESAWRAHRGVRVGSAPPPPEESEAAHGRIAAARGLLADAARSSTPRLRLAVRAAEALLLGPPGRDDAWSTLAEVEGALRKADAAMLAAWLSSLPRPERAALGPRCRLRAGARDGLTRPASYRETLLAHLEDAAREAGLLRLRGSV